MTSVVIVIAIVNLLGPRTHTQACHSSGAISQGVTIQQESAKGD